jgi:Leucine-rich repeat (LRR) protein
MFQLPFLMNHQHRRNHCISISNPHPHSHNFTQPNHTLPYHHYYYYYYYSITIKGIGRVENLIGFNGLIKLYLDNNNIEDMTNINQLVNLKWLDMSFNKIR